MKKRTGILLLAVLLAGTAAGAVACAADADLPEFDYDYTTPAKEFGDGIALDGVLDERAWSEGRALEAEIRNTTVHYVMRSSFGEAGVYFGFEIGDDAVYYNEEREIWANSGIEFCVGSPESKDLTYEIDLNAGGKRMLRKYVGQTKVTYLNWLADYDAAVRVDGTLNGECRGYSAEIYLPYSLFRRDNTNRPVETLYVNPGIVRASSAGAHTTDRLWYSIGEEERGLDWAPSSPNWYRFTSGEGLIRYAVSLSETAGGTISGADSFYPGDSYRLRILPDDGWYLSELTSGRKSLAGELFYEDGVAVWEGILLGDSEISAVFSRFQQGLFTLSGRVRGAEPEEISFTATCSGVCKRIDIAQDGNYSVRLPRGAWTLRCTAEGAAGVVRTLNISADETLDIVLAEPYLVPSGEGEWDFSGLGAGYAEGVSDGWWVYAEHATLHGARIRASATVSMPERAAGSSKDLRAGLYFKTAEGGLMIAITAAADGYRLQAIYAGTGREAVWLGSLGRDGLASLIPDLAARLHGGGVTLSCLYDRGKLSVWLDGVLLTEAQDVGTEYGFTAETEVVPGIAYCDVSHATFSDLSFASEE